MTTPTMPANNDGDFAPPPAGTHRAVCYRIIDLGTQEVEWSGEKKHQHKILMSWELSDEHMEDGQPFTIHSRYTFSSSERSKFRQHLESWRGAPFKDSDFGPGGFDIRNVLGVPCLLTVIHNEKNDKTYANIASISGLPKGTEKPAPQNEQIFLWLDKDLFVPATYESLSDGIRNTIAKSPEFAELQGKTNGYEANAEPDTSGYNDGSQYADEYQSEF